MITTRVNVLYTPSPKKSYSVRDMIDEDALMPPPAGGERKILKKQETRVFIWLVIPSLLCFLYVCEEM